MCLVFSAQTRFLWGTFPFFLSNTLLYFSGTIIGWFSSSRAIQFPRDIINILLTLFSGSILLVMAPCFFSTSIHGAYGKNVVCNLHHSSWPRLVRGINSLYKYPCPGWNLKKICPHGCCSQNIMYKLERSVIVIFRLLRSMLCFFKQIAGCILPHMTSIFFFMNKIIFTQTCHINNLVALSVKWRFHKMVSY